MTTAQAQRIQKELAAYRQNLLDKQRQTQQNHGLKKRLQQFETDFAGFCAHYFPHIATAEMAPFQLQMAHSLLADPAAFIVCQWARGLSKTSTARMAILWLLCLGKLRFGLLASSSREKALKLMGELQIELEENRALCEDYGLKVQQGHWRRGDFSLQGGRGFRAYGKGQNPRGEQLKGKRPDFIWLDDIDDDHECRNPKRVEQSHRWVMESLYMAGSPGATRLLALNNVIAPHSIITKLAQVAGACLQRVNILNEAGESAWPGKYSLADIQLMIRRLGYRSSQQEYFNNPVATGTLFRAEHIRYEALYSPGPALAYIDPSWTETGDYKAAVVLCAHQQRYWVLACFCRQCRMEELVHWCYSRQAELPITRWYMEANFHQKTLLQPFYTQGLEAGSPLPILADNRKKEPKLTRIGRMATLFEQGLVYWAAGLQQDPDTQTLLAQLMALEAGSRAHDDGPDALEGALALLMKQNQQTPGPVYRVRPKQDF